MKKTITIPIFIALCFILFASCSQKPIPGFTRAKSDGHQASRKAPKEISNELSTQADTIETSTAALQESRADESAVQEQSSQKAELKQRTSAIADQLKNIDRSQLSKKQQRLLNKLDKRIQKMENRPSETHGNGALTTGLVLILAGLILLILGRILFIFGIFGLIFIVLGLVFLLVGIIKAADD